MSIETALTAEIDYLAERFKDLTDAIAHRLHYQQNDRSEWYSDFEEVE